MLKDFDEDIFKRFVDDYCLFQVGNWIRIKSGITLKEKAGEINESHTICYRIENGKAVIDIEAAEQIKTCFIPICPATHWLLLQRKRD